MSHNSFTRSPQVLSFRRRTRGRNLFRHSCVEHVLRPKSQFLSQLSGSAVPLQHAVALEVMKRIPLADMPPEAAFIAHADFAQYSAGGDVVCEEGCIEGVQPQPLDPVVQDGGSRFGGVTLAPER